MLVTRVLDNASPWRNWSFSFGELHFLCLCEFLLSYMSKILLPQKGGFSSWFLSLVSTVNMTFALVVSGLESAALALISKCWQEAPCRPRAATGGTFTGSAPLPGNAHLERAGQSELKGRGRVWLGHCCNSGVRIAVNSTLCLCVGRWWCGQWHVGRQWPRATSGRSEGPGRCCCGMGLMWSGAGALQTLQNGVGASNRVLLAIRALCWRYKMNCVKHRQPGSALGV